MKRKRIVGRTIGTDETTKLEFNFTFEQAFTYFVSAKKSEGLREKTIKSYYEHFNFFNNWMNEYFSDVEKVNDLATFMIREYLNYMRDDHFNYKTKEHGLALLTINQRLRFLKTFYNFLYKEELVNQNPPDQVKYIKMDERKFTPLTEEEMERLMKVPNHDNYPQFRDFCIMNLLYDSAMRIFEAITITKGDLDIKGRRIILDSEKTKGRKSRLIPLSNYTLKLLLELMNENQTHFPEEEHLFLNWYGEPMSEDTFRRNLKRYVKMADIHKNFSCHDFRRMSISEMLKNGASLFSVMSISGHSQLQTVKKYVHFDEQTIKNQHELYSPVVKMRLKRKRR